MYISGPALQIAVSYEQNIPEEIVSHFVSEIASPGLDVKSEAREPGFQAGFVWLVPTAVIIFIGKAYFDSFLKEMGKDHYNLLKKSITALWKYFFGNERTIKVNLVSTKGKVSSEAQYSSSFSLMSDVLVEYRLKYLLKDNISQADFEKSIAQFFSFLEELSSGVLNPEIRQHLESKGIIGRTILLTYDDGKLKVLHPLPDRNAKNDT